jgi:hypothetical protein
MKFLIGIESSGYSLGPIEKGVEADFYSIETIPRILHLYKDKKQVAAFNNWVYIRKDDGNEKA